MKLICIGGNKTQYTIRQRRWGHNGWILTGLSGRDRIEIRLLRTRPGRGLRALSRAGGMGGGMALFTRLLTRYSSVPCFDSHGKGRDVTAGRRVADGVALLREFRRRAGLCGWNRTTNVSEMDLRIDDRSAAVRPGRVNGRRGAKLAARDKAKRS